MSSPLLSVRDLEIAFRIGDSDVPVVRDLSFDVHHGETLGIVGESGCGKSITDRKSTRLNSSHITRSRMPSSA